MIGAAVLDDILGVLALAFLYQFAVQQEVSLAATGQVGLFIVLFMLLSPFVAKLAGGIIDLYDQHATTPGLLITIALALILLFSWMAHAVGAPLIMGGFAAGITLSQHFRFNVMHRLGLPALNQWLASSPKLAQPSGDFGKQAGRDQDDREGGKKLVEFHGEGMPETDGCADKFTRPA